MVWPGGHPMVYVLAWWGMAWYMLLSGGYGMVWPVGHDIVYRMAWRGRHGTWYGMVYGMAWRVWHSIGYGLPDMAWHMVWPSEIWHGIWYRLVGMVYGMTWRGMAWYIVWPGGHGMVYVIKSGEVWHIMWKCLCEFHVLWHCLGLWYRSHVEKLMSVGSPVHTYRTRSQVEGPLHACSVHMYSSCSLVNWEIVNIYSCISLFWDRILDSHSYCVLSVHQAFYESLYLF